MNRHTAQQKLEYLFDLSMDAAEQVLLSDDPKTATAKVQLFRVIAELGRKMPSKSEEKFADEDINRMSPEELRSFLEKNGISVKQETTLTLPSDDRKEDE